MSIYATIELKRAGHQDLPAEMNPRGEGLVYGRALPRAAGKLDALARELGVLPITTFFDDSGMLSDDERAMVGLPPAEEKWCDAHAGLRTVEALLSALAKDDPAYMAGLLNTTPVVWDLQAAQIILKRAVEDGQTFRFHVC
jgi:hypothetical protein